MPLRAPGALAALFASLASACSASPDGLDIREESQPIIGGNAVTSTSEFPDMAAVLNLDLGKTQLLQQFCGATLIDDPYRDPTSVLSPDPPATIWAVSAAHCFVVSDDHRAKPGGATCLTTPSRCRLLVGTLKLSQTTTNLGRELPISAIHVHPNYDPTKMDNDVALIRLTNAETRDSGFTGIVNLNDFDQNALVTPRLSGATFTDGFSTNTLSKYQAFPPVKPLVEGPTAWRYATGAIFEDSNSAGDGNDGPRLINKAQLVHDGDVSVNIQSSDNDTAGVVGRFTIDGRDKQSFYQFVVGQTTLTASITLTIGSNIYVLGSKKLSSFAWSSNPKLTLRFRGVNLTGLIDGVQVVTATATKDVDGTTRPTLTQGRAGFFKRYLTNARFDNFQIVPQTDGTDDNGATYVRGSLVTAIGWGATSVGSDGRGIDYSSDLMAARDMEYIGRGTGCYNHSDYSATNHPLTTNMICAADFFMDTCQGDSGGPLFAKSRLFTTSWSLLGITSFGVSCAEERYPGIYTLASNYRSWIDSIQAQFPPDPWD